MTRSARLFKMAGSSVIEGAHEHKNMSAGLNKSNCVNGDNVFLPTGRDLFSGRLTVVNIGFLKFTKTFTFRSWFSTSASRVTRQFGI